MISLLTCLGARHDLRLVLLALVICVVGAFATMRLFERALHGDRLSRLAWTFVASAVAAGAAWSTHFVAMLAYLVDAPVHYDPVLTIASLIIAFVAIHCGLLVAGASRHPALPSLGGAVMGLGIAAMHYVGMLAWQVEGTVFWHPALVSASVSLATALTAATFSVARGDLGPRLARWSPAFLVAGIVSLHFTGMAALQVTIAASVPRRFDHEALALAFATALVGLLVIATGSFAWLIDQRARRDSAAQIRAANLRDDLTRLPNREGLADDLARRLAASPPDEKHLMIMVKLDQFADFVDRHGTTVADRVLREAAARLVSARKPGVLLARTGRFGFGIVGPDVPPGELRVRLEQLIAVLSSPLTFDTAEYRLHPRIGVACYPDDADTVPNLIARAELALERALADPLNPLCFYDEWQDAATRRRHALALDLAGALARDEFEMHYQPQVLIETGRIIGQEALIRWRHPEFGMVSPAEFIPLAERTGAILAIGDWALRTACKAALHWPDDWSVAVNVSPLQLRQPDLPERVHAALIACGLSPRRLEIELTESLLLDDRTRALHVLRRIRALGVRLALDDFGVGYSSLDVLRRFPFDKIKLDKTFVDDVETSPQSRAILHAMLALGRTLDIPVLVEGVETERQLAILRAEGCRKVQGYLTGRPVPEDQVFPSFHRAAVA
ncbi:MAG: EAL domain-containing protein [Sphingomonadales bacterium]|nr:EAL domain-containing protein [Sphingomonadales bacterium]